MQDLARMIYAQDSWQTPRNARTLAAYMALENREIGARIASLRKAKGKPPQEVVAQELNVSYRSYQAWEAGDTKPSWRNLSKLAEYYGVSQEYILLGDGDGQPVEPEQLDRIEVAISGLDEQVRLLRGETVAGDAEVLKRLDEELRTIRESREPPPR